MVRDEGKLILVVDDEDVVRNAVRKALAEAGYDVTVSHNGADALAKITRQHFDAVVSDVRMPEMSGIELVTALRRLCSNTIVILLSVMPDPDGKMAGMPGVAAYLQKPCKASLLKETLDRAFAEHMASREAFLSLDSLSSAEVSILSGLMSNAAQNAISGIAGMVGREVEVTTGNHRQIPAKDVAELLRNPEDKLVGVNLDIEGDTHGHMLLIYPPQVAYGLADLIMGQPLGQTTNLEGIEESALQEMGNIAGSFFLNSLADAANMRLMSTPPSLIIGQAQRVLDNAFRPLAKKDSEVFAIRMVFETNGSCVSGYFLALASQEFLNVLVGQVAAIRASAP